MKMAIYSEPEDMTKPRFTVFDIQVSVGDTEFKKGKELFDSGKVKNITLDVLGFNAIVSGTKDYVVSVSSMRFDHANCDCYLGTKGTLCKHMIALAIASVFKYRPEDAHILTMPLDQAVCSGEVREITKEELVNIKNEIKTAFTFIKNYNGPSKTWFTYQNSLLKGSRLMLYALSNLSICKVGVDVCIDIIKKLDNKLAKSGLDDSDGTIGDLIEEIMELLGMFISEDPNLATYIVAKFPKKTNFGWDLNFYITQFN